MVTFQKVDVETMFDQYSNELLEQLEEIDDELDFLALEAEPKDADSIINANNFNDNLEGITQ